MDAAGAVLFVFCANARLPKLSMNTSASTKLITFLTVAFSFGLISAALGGRLGWVKLLLQ